jgi:hypothetical protein
VAGADGRVLNFNEQKPQCLHTVYSGKIKKPYPYTQDLQRKCTVYSWFTHGLLRKVELRKHRKPVPVYAWFTQETHSLHIVYT